MHVRFLSSGVAPLHAEASELKRHLLVPHVLNIQDRKTIIDTPKKRGGGLPWWRSGEESTCPVQGTRVRALVREDPTCRGANKSVHHNY